MSLDSLKSEQKSYKKDLSEEKANLEMYQEKVDALDSLYDKMITIIDNNLDEINSEKRYYQNLIYQSKGIIGDIQAALNSISVKIQS